MLFWSRIPKRLKEILAGIVMLRKTRTVYIISSLLFNKSYIGSTCQRLCDRLAKHKHQSCKAREVIQHGDCMIAPLLVVPNCTKSEIELKEKEFLKQYKDILVNKKTVLQTKEELQEQLKQYRIKNANYSKIKSVCDCGGRYTNANISIHKKTTKHLEYLKG